MTVPTTILAIWSLSLASSSSRAVILFMATVSTVLCELNNESAHILGGDGDLMDVHSTSSSAKSDSVIDAGDFGFILILQNATKICDQK